jgi:hypothetical protein
VKRIENEVGPGEAPQASGALRLLKFLGLNTRLHHALGEGESYRSEAWRYCSALANVERKTPRLCREFRPGALPRWKERKQLRNHTKQVPSVRLGESFPSGYCPAFGTNVVQRWPEHETVFGSPALSGRASFERLTSPCKRRRPVSWLLLWSRMPCRLRQRWFFQ